MTVCFTSADHDTLQQDLLLLEQWVAMWQKNFTPSKCNTMSISLKHQPSRYMYLNTLCNTPYFWWVSLFRNGRLILHCQPPLTGQSRLQVYMKRKQQRFQVYTEGIWQLVAPLSRNKPTWQCPSTVLIWLHCLVSIHTERYQQYHDIKLWVNDARFDNIFHDQDRQQPSVLYE